MLTCLNFILPLAIKVLFYSVDISNSNIKHTVNLTDSYKLDQNSGIKIENDKIICKHKIKKIYDNIFDKNNKSINTINPFPFIKESYIKTSSLNVNIEEYNIKTSGLSESNTLKLTKKDLNYLGYGSNHTESNELSSEKVAYGFSTTVIDLKAYLGINQDNKTSIILKDLNDPTSKNLISTLKNTSTTDLAFDKYHCEKNDCFNYKYLNYDLGNSKYVDYNKQVLKTFKSLNFEDSAMVKEVSFSIKQETVIKLKNNSLIIETEDVNLPPVKQQTSFATQGENFNIGD